MLSREEVWMKLDKAHSMLLKLLIAQYRDGWEEGESEEEVRDACLDYLANNDLDPVNNQENCAKLLGMSLGDFKDRVGDGE